MTMRHASAPRFAAALAATNLKATFALRRSFWLQAVFMLVNNVTFFVVWIIFFDRFGEIRGWGLEDTAALFGIVALGWGISVVLFGGAGTLARTIADGELDPLLVQPKSPLLQAIAVRSNASGWGDIATGIAFLAILSTREPGLLPFALLGALASAAVFTATAILFQASAFWLSRIEVAARQVQEFVLTFSLYPASLFSGVLRTVLFTAIPAGFAGYLPADLVRSPDPAAAAALAGGVLVYCLGAAALFQLGLRSYTSGSRFGGVW
jgi:ABC-2 type transport system permease protein